MRTRPGIFIGAVLAATAACAAIATPAAAGDRSAGGDWPRGQLLPRFAPVEALDVADMAAHSGDERLLFGTLQGDSRAVVEHMRPEGVVLNLFFDRTVQHGRLPRGTPLTTGPIATTVEQGKAQVRDAIADCPARRPCFVTLGVLS